MQGILKTLFCTDSNTVIQLICNMSYLLKGDVEMKRIVSLIIALTLICAFTACGKKDETATNNKKPDPSKTEATEFVKPENYASILLVTINPQFKLYIDEAGTVLAIEAVNKDAKSMKDSISYENKNFETVLQEIVVTANEKGFIKEDATINLEIEETKNTTVNATDILNKATTATNHTVTELKIKVTVKVEEVKEDTENQVENVEQQPTTDSNSNENNANNNTSASTPTEAPPAHSHSFSAATCTAPQKCSCGATNGSALGHNYVNGVCSRCKAKDPNFVSYTSVTQKNGRWTLQYVIGDVYYNAYVKIYGSASDYNVGVTFGDALSSFPPEEQEIMKPDCIEFNGALYYCARGTGDGLASVAENGTTVTVTDLSGNKLVLTRTGENNFKVQSSPARL